MPSTDFTISPVIEVLAFARTKPPREKYRYGDLDNCALAQFTRYAGYPLHGRERHRLERVYGTAACCGGTFGGFARQLERIVEPNLRKRLWARLTGKPIGQPLAPEPSIWISVDAYMSERVRANA